MPASSQGDCGQDRARREDDGPAATGQGKCRREEGAGVADQAARGARAADGVPAARDHAQAGADGEGAPDSDPGRLTYASPASCLALLGFAYVCVCLYIYSVVGSELTLKAHIRYCSCWQFHALHTVMCFCVS